MMCRYAWHWYKAHMVCFTCRIALKEITECPHCRQPMANMGLDFKAPRRTNMREWKRVHLIYQAGKRYHSCGCSGPGRLAPTLRDAKQLLEQAWKNNPTDAFSEGRIPSRKPALYEKPSKANAKG